MEDWRVQYVLPKDEFDGDSTVRATKAMHGAKCQARIDQPGVKCVVGKGKCHEMDDRTHGRTQLILIDR